MAKYIPNIDGFGRMKSPPVPLNILVRVKYSDWKHAREGYITEEKYPTYTTYKFTWLKKNPHSQTRQVHPGYDPDIYLMSGKVWSCYVE